MYVHFIQSIEDLSRMKRPPSASQRQFSSRLLSDWNCTISSLGSWACQTTLQIFGLPSCHNHMCQFLIINCVCVCVCIQPHINSFCFLVLVPPRPKLMISSIEVCVWVCLLFCIPRKGEISIPKEHGFTYLRILFFSGQTISNDLWQVINLSWLMLTISTWVRFSWEDFQH